VVAVGKKATRKPSARKPLPETTVRMKAVRQRDTAPEIALRKLLHTQGVRFRACPADLPGRPDIANKARKWCIFVHGCFWHGHRGCKLSRLPRTNHQWWEAKITANRKRDSRKAKAMRALGFRVETVWQCEVERPEKRVSKLARALRPSR
jgi:DNA mismatch endonuclease, patch repair protein